MLKIKGCIIGNDINIILSFKSKLMAGSVEVDDFIKGDLPNEMLLANILKVNYHFVILALNKRDNLEISRYLIKENIKIFVITENEEVRGAYNFLLNKFNVDEIIYKIIKLLK